MRHLRLYQAIRCVVKHGSIRKASEYQMISPSALNRAILTFEDEIGVDIFERLPTGVRLSAPGELLYYHLEDHLTRMSDFADLVAEMKGLRAGLLRVSVSSDISETLLPEVLIAYRDVYPGIETRVVIAEDTRQLLDRDVDLALVTRPETETGVAVAAFQKVNVTGQVAIGHPGGRIGVSDIPDHVLILPPEGTGLRDSVDLTLRKYGVVPVATHVHPGIFHGLSAGPPADLQFVLECKTGKTLGRQSKRVEVGGLKLPPVQITLLKRTDGVLPRPAERFVSVLQDQLHRLETDN